MKRNKVLLSLSFSHTRTRTLRICIFILIYLCIRIYPQAAHSIHVHRNYAKTQTHILARAHVQTQDAFEKRKIFPSPFCIRLTHSIFSFILLHLPLSFPIISALSIFPLLYFYSCALIPCSLPIHQSFSLSIFTNCSEVTIVHPSAKGTKIISSHGFP